MNTQFAGLSVEQMSKNLFAGQMLAVVDMCSVDLDWQF